MRALITSCVLRRAAGPHEGAAAPRQPASGRPPWSTACARLLHCACTPSGPSCIPEQGTRLHAQSSDAAAGMADGGNNKQHLQRFDASMRRGAPAPAARGAVALLLLTHILCWPSLALAPASRPSPHAC